jgi:GDP-4-dehydro-6-deoxy-D-mannose reductase
VRVLITGATGFVGRWLADELRSANHEVIEAPPSSKLDLSKPDAATDLVARSRPDAVAHLAAISSAAEAARNPARAITVNAGATTLLVDAIRRRGAIPTLVTSSSEVYAAPAPANLPLTEDAPVHPDRPYGRSKLEQEHAALSASDGQVPILITRAFNHTGPGQRRGFVAPAFASRVLSARASGDARVRVGNIDVRRDFTDVRDVVRAYRLLLEHVFSERSSDPLIVNVASGRATSIGELLRLIGVAAAFEPEIVVDPALVREDEPEDIVGDPSRLRALTGWEPEIPLERTVADLVASLEEGR